MSMYGQAAPPAKKRSTHKSVIIHGPQGSGKTRHAQQLADHFGLDRVIEAEEGPHQLRSAAIGTGALILTNVTPHRTFRRQLTIAQALKLLQGKPGYPF
ncbi:MAG TPA: hypothetical protein VE934_12145 [Polaromonas sp.]|uniref:hypothetical protein n=1 Tax=Polaromonas sp. TaxID=1869339 RepID=UPI002D5E2A81|nr:hypothetical protein [Polaromonas sp.]HYW57707.1 hypothetical protein [Polaromonas sp.]